MPEKTAEDFPICENKKRWFATGDIGTWLPSGCLKIIDRKKDLVKLKAGEYIALGAIEAALKACPYVENICVVASGFCKRPIALVVPAPFVYTWAKKNGIDGTPEKLCADDRVKAEVMRMFEEVGAQRKLNKWELPSKLYLEHDPWTPEIGRAVQQECRDRSRMPSSA
eukprot:TRINITY_DN19973_c0_g1_i4.p1 TRINITY_DN19973_c0_g1~~TRINITY_DN19973_c0_g1_i4.p1  ORF type:complete len:187 (+),score=23.81 TRINITY_DN19973_c0_g1_i4:60-563(+)